MVDAEVERERIELALANSVRWCDTICRAHGIPGRIEASCWSNPRVVPRFYPNLITLDERSGEAQRAEIQTLIESAFAPAWGVKDSFACLDLNDLGFRKLFDARWIWRAAEAPLPKDDSGVVWSTVDGARQLEIWEAAWGNHDTNASAPIAGALPRVFPAELLDDPDAVFLAGRSRDSITAVAIANRSDDVVGVSNVFALRGETERCWAGCVRAVEKRFPKLPMVGYQRGNDLASAQSVGFESVGPLRVWLRATD